jgi:aminopeptidase N
MNVETIKGEQSSELQTTTFKRSVKMSTYLVAFLVSDFTSTSSFEELKE